MAKMHLQGWQNVPVAYIEVPHRKPITGKMLKSNSVADSAIVSDLYAKIL